MTSEFDAERRALLVVAGLAFAASACIFAALWATVTDRSDATILASGLIGAGLAIATRWAIDRVPRRK
jgi:hypothetical protein